MAYAGKVNKTIVAKLQGKDCNAIGLTGADANLIQAHRRPPQDGLDFGWVGDVDGVNADFLLQLLEEGRTPVIAPLTHDGEGHLLNTNADTIATEISRSLAGHYAVKLYYLFDLPGVLKKVDEPDSLIPEIAAEDIHQMIAKGILNEGMLPKIENALLAKSSGVKAVRICHHKALDNAYELDNQGTEILS